MSDMMDEDEVKQIRFCPACGCRFRDDDFEVGLQTDIEQQLNCPICGRWLWSIYIYPNSIQITDWDECGIHGPDKLVKGVMREVSEIMEEKNE